MRAILSASVLFLGPLAPALAQDLPQSVVDACWTKRTPAEARAGYCTRAIESGALGVEQLVHAYVDRGDAYRVLRRWDRALADYAHALRLDPGKLSARFGRANALAGNGDEAAAKAEFASIAAQDASVWHDLAIRGAAQYRLAKYRAAMADLDRAIELKPDNGFAYNWRASIHLRLRQYDRAIADFDQAIRLEADEAAAYLGRGNAYQIKKQYDRAIADFEQAIKLQPDGAEGFHRRSSAYHDKGQYVRALADLDRALQLAPNDGDILNSRCWTRAVSGQGLDQALADCNAAIKREPKNPDYLDSRGLVHLKAGRFAAAEQDYTEALVHRPIYGHFLFGRGIARLRQGNTQAGNLDLETARQMDTDAEAAYASYGLKP